MKTNYENLKAQCVHRASQFVNANKVSFATTTLDFSGLSEELDSFTQIDIDKDSTFKIIRKDQQKLKLGRSPDYADAFIMRFMFSDSEETKLFVAENRVFSTLGYNPYNEDEQKQVYFMDT